MSFPISLQAGNTDDYQDSAGAEVSLFAELAESAIDFSTKLFARRQNTKPAKLSEQKKLFLAQNPDTPADILVNLSSDPSSAVRNALVFNALVPASILFKLASDPDRFVRAQARARISMAA